MTSTGPRVTLEFDARVPRIFRRSARPMTRSHAAVLLLALAFLAGACNKGPAYGSANAIIAVVDPSVADRVEPLLREALEREVRTTRSERIFEITFTTPDRIGEFRNWRRIIVVEPLESATLVADLADPPADADRVVEAVEDEWARGQTVHLLAARGADETVRLVAEHADSLFAEAHAAYAALQVERMWASGPDSALFQSLLADRGFGLVLPRLYAPAPRSAPDSTLVFYAADPRRVVSLHWGPRPAALDADSVLAIRRAWGAGMFPSDVLEEEPPAGPPWDSRVRLGDGEALRLQGVWRGADAADAGVFVTWAVPCGDRLVLIDGNVFAPDREKYPYVLQLEEIAATFRCEAGR